MRPLTGFLLLATGLVWLWWELVLLQQKATPISVVMKDAALTSCFLPFGWTLLAGHWWMNWDIADDRTPFALWPAWVAVGVALLAADLAVAQWAPPRAGWPLWARFLRYPGLWALIGLAMGPLTWPQRAKL